MLWGIFVRTVLSRRLKDWGSAWRESSWVGYAIILWGGLSAYDLFGSQLAPDWLQTHMPKAKAMITATSNWLPWWAWGWIGTAILMVMAMEYATRLQIRADSARESERRYASRGAINDGNFVLSLPPHAPDLEWLDKKVSFTLGEAAALWLNYQPERPPWKKDVRDSYWKLFEAVKSGRLKAALTLDESIAWANEKIGMFPAFPEDDAVTVATIVNREELRRYALTSKDRPMFLFKSARAGRNPNEQR